MGKYPIRYHGGWNLFALFDDANTRDGRNAETLVHVSRAIRNAKSDCQYRWLSDWHRSHSHDCQPGIQLALWPKGDRRPLEVTRMSKEQVVVVSFTLAAIAVIAEILRAVLTRS